MAAVLSPALDRNDPRIAPRSPASALSFGGVLRSEWIKMRTLRSTVWSYIAVVALTLGMAIDANVLINERIREELRWGATPHAALQAGYERAWNTILDSNVTTLIAVLVLFWLGSGPVRGFAVTLTVGVLASMFTAVTVTRLMVAYWLRWTRPQLIPI